MATIPIPREAAQLFQANQGQCRNLGLWFDRYVAYSPGWTMEGGQKAAEAQKLVDACNRWANDAAYRLMYENIRRRWHEAMVEAGAEPFTMAPEWRFVVGLGRDSAFETGLTLHRIYGCPYIPGSTLKGATRAWAEAQDEFNAGLVNKVFGDQENAGAAVFFDALPVTPPRLKLDVINPHYPDYYRPGNQQYPTDWQSPVPVYFITVETGTHFLFGVGRRKKDRESIGIDAKQTRLWLESALQEMGIGGKTTSGYGYWNWR